MPGGAFVEGIKLKNVMTIFVCIFWQLDIH